MLTFDQASLELNADGKRIAQALRHQYDSGDEFAKSLIGSYTHGCGNGTEAETARVQFLADYERWRAANWPSMVAPIAAQLGHLAPALAPADVLEEPQRDATDLFAPPQGAVAFAPSAPTPQPEPSAQAPAADTKERKRISWSQPEIVALTRAVLSATTPEAVGAALRAFVAANAKFTREAVIEKAVELGLIEAPPASAAPAALTATDKAAIDEAIVEWIAPEGFPAEIRLLRLQHAGTAIRELAKRLGKGVSA